MCLHHYHLCLSHFHTILLPIWICLDTLPSLLTTTITAHHTTGLLCHSVQDTPTRATPHAHPCTPHPHPATPPAATADGKQAKHLPPHPTAASLRLAYTRVDVLPAWTITATALYQPTIMDGGLRHGFGWTLHTLALNLPVTCVPSQTIRHCIHCTLPQPGVLGTRHSCTSTYA